jgi:hypothetical protein
MITSLRAYLSDSFAGQFVALPQFPPCGTVAGLADNLAVSLGMASRLHQRIMAA